MRILIFRPGALGDLIVTLPLLQTLRQFDPGGTIHVIAHPVHRELLRFGHSDGDASTDDPSLGFLYSLDSDPAAAAPAGHLPPANRWGVSYDAALIITRNREDETVQALRRIGIGRILHINSSPSAGLSIREHLRRGAADILESRSRASSNRNAPGGEQREQVNTGPADPIWPFPSITPQDENPPMHTVENEPPPEHSRENRLILHAGAGSKKKQAPTHLFVRAAKLAHSLGVPVTVLDGPADRSATIALMQEACAKGTDLDVISVDSSVSAATFLCRSRFFIGNDSGITHLAAACGLRGIALFGPTDPLVWSPGGRILTLQGPGASLPEANFPDANFPEANILQSAMNSLLTDG